MSEVSSGRRGGRANLATSFQKTFSIPYLKYPPSRIDLSAVLIGLTDMDGGGAPGIYYDLGVVVVHKHYGYRGAIVAVDPRCMAGETWYNTNKTQPPREQPWYHVLVHDSGGLSTYVAQSNLKEDPSGQPIEHPRLRCYFADFKDGRYQLKESTGSGGCGI